MSRTLEFYKCKSTGLVVEVVADSADKGVLSHAGEEMKLLKANSSDGAGEKHVPVLEVEGNVATVKVGSVAHPMTEEHLINFIVLLTEKGVQRVDLAHTDEPVAVFSLLEGDKVIAAYEYCNLHGLWVTEA